MGRKWLLDGLRTKDQASGKKLNPEQVTPFLSAGEDSDGDFASNSTVDTFAQTRVAREVDLLAAPTLRQWDPAKFTQVERLATSQWHEGAVDRMLRVGDEGGYVVVKCVPASWALSNHQDFAFRRPYSKERPWYELGVLRYLTEQDCQYSCKLLGIFQSSTQLFMVMAHAELGDLFNWCVANGGSPGKAREARMRPITQQVFAGVQWLHDHGIAHRDISLENIVVGPSEDGGAVQAKLIDFGMASAGDRHCSGRYGKGAYQAPEMSVPIRYDAFLSDVFALGVASFAMNLGDYPWISTEPGKCNHYGFIDKYGFDKFLQHRKVRGGSGETLIEVTSTELHDMLVQLLAFQPVTRATLGERCYEEEFQDSRSVWPCRWLQLLSI